MTKRIFRSIFFTALGVLLASAVLILGILYQYFSQELENEVHNQAVYLSAGVDALGVSYLEEIEEPEDGTRITLIASDGTVLYDNEADPASMENHAKREEVVEAKNNGIGESSRYSATLSEQTYYYALLLENGDVLRLSSTQDSSFALVLGMIYPFVAILMLTLAVSGFLAWAIARRIVQPLNEMNLDHPEEIDTYEELTPLLTRMSQQNHQIDEQLQEIAQRQQEFVTITENMSEGLLVIDAHTNVLSCNNAALQMLGSVSLPKQGSALALNRSEAFRTAVSESLEGNHSLQMLRLHGHSNQVLANPVWKDDQVIGAVLVLLDVTEREERESLRREFTANVSHELKTPLTTISGFAELLAAGMVRSEDVSHFGQNIYDEAQRLINLVVDIIHLSQLDEVSEPQMTSVDLSVVASSVLDRIRPVAEKQQITVKTALDSAVVMGNASILDEMIFNLCDNAIKYNRKQGMLTVSTGFENGHAYVSVKDNGIGIPKSDQERVFERFYRVDKSHSRAIGGTGLGLSIVKHGAIYHHATISLESELGKGTTVKVSF